jgi:hypothetical protein
LGGTSYAWETTIRQRSNGEAANLSLNPNAPLEVTGKTEREGYTEVTLLPSKQTIDAPVTAFTKFGDAVGHTPLGWLRRTEIRDAEGNEKDRLVPFEGKSVRLSRAFAAAMRATSLHTPLEEVFDLISEVKSYREAGGYLIGDLRDAAIEKLWGDPKAKSAPEIQGNLIFRSVMESRAKCTSCWRSDSRVRKSGRCRGRSCSGRHGLREWGRREWSRRRRWCRSWSSRGEGTRWWVVVVGAEPSTIVECRSGITPRENPKEIRYRLLAA